MSLSPVYSRRGSQPEPHLPVLPSSQSEVKGDLGALYATCRRLGEDAYRANMKLAEVRAELAHHEGVIRSARPRCDWTQVAASKAAVEYLSGAVTAANKEASSRNDDATFARQNLESRWSRYQTLRRYLIGETNQRPTDGGTLELSDDAILKELAVLIGELSWPDESRR